MCSNVILYGIYLFIYNMVNGRKTKDITTARNILPILYYYIIFLIMIKRYLIGTADALMYNASDNVFQIFFFNFFERHIRKA